MLIRYAAAILLLLVAALFLLDRFAPEPERRRAALGLPSAGSPAGDAERGRRVFAANCVVCHGETLGGTDKGPPLVHSVYKPNHHSDLAIRLAVKNGVVAHHWQFGNMPPIPGITPEQVSDLIAFIRHRQREAGIIP